MTFSSLEHWDGCLSVSVREPVSQDGVLPLSNAYASALIGFIVSAVNCWYAPTEADAAEQERRHRRQQDEDDKEAGALSILRLREY